MQIKDVLLALGNGAFFYDDQAAIRAGGAETEMIYVSEIIKTGFTAIRVWLKDWGIAMSESVRITKRGAGKPSATYPDAFVK
ncbi:hypothetical protein [Mesorhizobium neociceri]|uniref:hypothetical protein n=1 Tax=Mesorhizobium neociceri TaxID=1307853 RepID=UPI0038B31305